MKCNRRLKGGKEHRYWSIVGNRRCSGGRLVQRPVLYLGEINDSPRAAWVRSIEAFDADAGRSTQRRAYLLPRAGQRLPWPTPSKLACRTLCCAGRDSGAPAGFSISFGSSWGYAPFGMNGWA